VRQIRRPIAAVRAAFGPPLARGLIVAKKKRSSMRTRSQAGAPASPEASQRLRRPEPEASRPGPDSPEPRIERGPGSPGFRRALVVIGGLYIAAVLCEGVKPSLHRLLYRPILFFCQIAALFPQAATHAIEYRAEGYTCSGRAIEIDVRPFFPIHADDKESRFERAMHFYHSDRTTMQALETYVMREHNRSDPERIGGVVFLSLLTPIPAPGSSFPRYARTPLFDHPKEQRKVWYATPHEIVLRRCKEGNL